MKQVIIDLIDEVKNFTKGKTIDAIFPPIVYVIGNRFFGLKIGIILALSFALILAILRLINKQSFIYALGGMAGVLIASGFAYLAGNAANYFLPRVITSGFFFLLSIVSLIIGRPIAALASHLTRGWAFDWFLRKDIKPAYTEVTIVWAILFLARMLLQIMLLRRANIVDVGLANILLGFPATFTVLILTYLYGIWRLKKLKGPGVYEYMDGKESPWVGQTKGF
ncbi:MAG: DUF3159 domain-containing protein [Gudongella sp.]|nr:DUF3159 domain-containing protein [Gudongella sp.]